VRVITVFAGDPDSTVPASSWDAKAGFTTLAQAARARRLEDADACRRLGVKPIWLPFADNLYDEGATDDDIWSAVAAQLDGADLILAPGFPLIHEDHLRICRLVRARLPDRLVGYYVEQPYAAWLRSGFSRRRPAEDEIARLQSDWLRLRIGPRSWVVKVQAMRAYTSQMLLLYQPAGAILSYELRRAGETVALPLADPPGKA
jgi:LmbE family N-acetylglucosaminyl deacetylase